MIVFAKGEDNLLKGSARSIASLHIRDYTAPLPAIDPDARRRRLTALLNAASLARETPAVYVVEDAHWIDEVSESMIADFFTVIPQTPSLVLATYRPEYEGALARVHGAQTIALAPLSDSETAALVSELLGPGPLGWCAGQEDRREGRRESVLRRGDGARTGRARRATGEPAHTCRRQRLARSACRHLAGDHRRSHRPARPESQAHAERGGGDRLAVQPRPAGNAGH